MTLPAIAAPPDACSGCRLQLAAMPAPVRVAYAWVLERFGSPFPHLAHRGSVSAAVDVAPHFVAACGISLNDCTDLKPH